jgi:NAD(P)-dependent dehydrogenase (short-subunit alcohol dehydrogenase family)
MGLFDLTGKVAVITGSSKGIGRAIAERMAEHGAKVVVSSRKLDLCEEVVRGIKDKGGEAIAVACNIGRKEECASLIEKANAAFGKVDILVCNAAINPYYGPLLDISDEAFDKIMASNIKSNVWLCALAIPDMAKRKEGSVIIVSSIGGLRGTPVIGAYGISKAADMALVRNLAMEWGQHNVRVNAIAPGLVKTDFARALWENPDTYQATIKTSPLRRIGEPDDIAGAAIFLASAAGNFTTGSTVIIDGGVTIAGRG